MSTPILDNLREASFRGVPFYTQSSRIVFSPGSILHKYPNSKRIEAEYLGETPRVFNLKIVIKGIGDQYFTLRNALRTALLQQSNGILIHPFEGKINCCVSGEPELIEEDIEHGIARYNVTFVRVDDKIYPTEVSNNIGSIIDKFEYVEDSIISYIDKAFDIISSSEVYQFALQSLQAISDVYDKITNETAMAIAKISDVKGRISIFNNNILSYTSGNDPLSTGLIALYSSVSDVGLTPLDQLSMWYKIFDNIPVSSNYSTSTYYRTQNKINADVLNGTAKSHSLALVYNYVSNLTFNSTSDIDDFKLNTDKRYNELSLSDNNLAYAINNLRTESNKYLDNIYQEIGDIVVIKNVSSVPLTTFLYNYYGNLNNYDIIKNLNNIHDPTDISGNIEIIV